MAAKKTSKKKTTSQQAPDLDLDTTSQEPAQSKAWIVVFGFVGIILVALALLYVYAQTTAVDHSEYTYNGFEFRPTPSGEDTIWVTEVYIADQPYHIPFYYHPSMVEDVAFEEGLADDIVQAVLNPEIPSPERVYISLDPDAGSLPVIGAVEISRIFGERYNMLNLRVQSALSREQEGIDTLVMSCEDAQEGMLVIEFRQTGTNAVSLEGTNCVLVEYDEPRDSIRVADRFAYELLGIM